MPYIGKQPLTGAYQLCDTITTSATATYNLLVGGSAVIPGSANNCIVSLNGVVQAPVGAFTVSGSTITFASTLSATDVIDFILILGNVFDIGTPTNGAVTNSSLNSNVITGQTAETSVAGGDLVLLYDDSASALRKMTRTNFVSGLATTNGITEADQWRITSTYSYSASQAYATLTANWERVDTDGFGLLGTGMTESSGVFTFPSTGIYLVTFTAHAETTTNNSRFVGGSIFTTTDGTNFGESNQIAGNALASTMGNNTRTTVTGQFQFDVTNVTTHKVRFEVTSNQNTTSFLGSTDASYTCVGFIRLGDT